MGSIANAADEFVFRSKLPDIEIQNNQPLHSYCFQNASEYPDKPCLINGATGEIFTYDDVQKISKRVAAGLRRLGVGRGDVIMLFLPNSPEFAFAFFGASYLGATSTTANPAYTPGEVQKQAAAAGVKVIITESASVPKVKDFAEEKGLVIVCTDEVTPDHQGCISFSVLKSEPELDEEVEIDPDDVVALPYSSGTTGLPKGVMLTHKSLITSVAQQVDGENPNLYYRSDDVVLCLLPLFHIYSLNSILLCGVRAGTAILIMRKFDVKTMLELVQKYRVTIGPFVPPIVVDLVKSPLTDEYDLSSIRLVMSGAAPMGKELQDKLTAKIPNCKLGQGYGMTEAGPVLCMCLAFAKEPLMYKSGSCGTVVRNAELKIVDPETGASLPRNKEGEICIRGHQIMKGYLNDQKATEETIDKEGWLHTGDIGYVDDDDQMFIVDRLKEIIKYNGYQVAPAELEALLIAHPEITGAAVIGMKVERSGEVPVAFVQKTDDSEITEDEIKQYIAKQVVFYKKIHKVFFTDSIPKNPSGKILRKELRGKLAAATQQC